MWFHQAAGKMCKDSAEIFNQLTSLWEPLPFKVQLTESGRWIARTESFSNKRVMLTPQRLPLGTQVIRLVEGIGEFLVYAEQPNIAKDKSYMFDYTILNAEVGYADLIGLVPTVKASGVSGEKVETVLGSYPIATDRFAGATSVLARDMNQSRVNCFMPSFASPSREHLLRWDGLEFDIKEVYPEFGLSHLITVQR